MLFKKALFSHLVKNNFQYDVKLLSKQYFFLISLNFTLNYAQCFWKGNGDKINEKMLR